MSHKPVFLSSLFLLYTLTYSQPDLVTKNSEQGDSAVAARTQELMQSGMPREVPAYQLAYQGIDARGLEKLKTMGIDVKDIAQRWGTRTVEEVAIFADCIVVGKVEKIRLVPVSGFNKYVYVKVERWLKGELARADTIVIRTSGSGPGPGPGYRRWEAHEMKFKKGERLLLLLSRAGFLLLADREAPFKEEIYKEDYPIMYIYCYGNSKLRIEGDWVTRVDFKQETWKEKLDTVVGNIANVTSIIQSVAKQGGANNE